MYLTSNLFFGLSFLTVSILSKPVDQHAPEDPTLTVDLIKRAPGVDPAPYPYGTPGVNEFLWQGWDPNDSGQRADALKIHNAWDDWQQMIYFALKEIDAVSDTFKRWFDAGDATNVKNVFLKMFDPSGIGKPTPLMTNWICEQADVKGLCAPSTNAYSVSNRGQFHYCPYGLQKPQANSLRCTDLDGYASSRMRTIALAMVHESTHWTQVGDNVLGKHITDKANGPSDCFNLSPSDKLINAQNYGWFASEAYFKAKGCTFTDPPPGTEDVDDNNDDSSVSPTSFVSGWCGIHVIQYQKNEANVGVASNSPIYQLQVCVYDGAKNLLNQFPGSTGNYPCAVFGAPNGVPQAIDTGLPDILYITAGAVDSDAILFSYGNQNWGSNDQPHHSNFGPYADGSRNGDTGFSC